MRARHWIWIAGATSALVALAAALVVGIDSREAADSAAPSSSLPVTPERVARGAYLARAGNCAGCHTVRGGAAFAGGRGIPTPFGTVYASNLTPDRQTGLGAWSADDFWQAMHHGRSRDGRRLYPAFPYPNYTLVTREDSDAIYAFLRTQPPHEQVNRAHDLRFPYDRQAALAVWRALFFRPGVYTDRSDRTVDWNRGAYLVRGLGHCDACHSARNALGASGGEFELGGGLMPVQNWYAPSLASGSEAGVADWQTKDVVALLKTGTSPHGSVLGPMAEVVYRSTQHLDDRDLHSIATYLQALPQSASTAPDNEQVAPAVMALGGDVYQDRCASCHGKQGEGASGVYPALAGSRKVNMASPMNIVRVIVDGGFAPSTEGNPRPFGMPPFGPFLNDAEIAAVATYVRNAWGNRAARVSELDVIRAR